MKEMDDVTNAEEKSSGAKTKSSQENNTHETKVKPKGLMTKLGKSDLLRLLSILEGELEAQDIFISDLQTRVQQEGSTKKRYFQHAMTDPFLALMRDSESTKERISQNDEEVTIEPLPLLEKVVSECKRQQNKVRQHIALSDAYFKLANNELLEVKRKYVRDTAVGDDVTAALEKEREKLRLQIRVEQTKSKKAESEYKNLLQAINKERQRFQIIITMLLEERSGRLSKLVDINDLSMDEMKEKYKQLLVQNEKLEALVANMKENEVKTNEEIQNLKQQLKTESNYTAATDLNLPTQPLEEKGNSKTSSSSVEDGVDTSSSCPAVSSPVTVTVRRTPTIIEKKKINPRDRYISNLTSKSCSQEPSKIPSHTDKVDHRSFDHGLRLSSSGIVSSPTSGASNFALNSPNQPSSAGSFPTPVLPSKTKKINIPSGSFQATRQKFQRFSNPKPSPPSTNKTESSLSTRHVKITSDVTSATDSPLPSVQATSKSEGKPAARKSIENSYKPQPPKPHRTSSAKSSREEAKNKVCPPPLPPKKPSYLGKAQNGKNTASVRNSRDDSKKTASLSNDKIPRSSFHAKSASSGAGAKSLGNHSSRLNTKRPSSLNSNNSNNTRTVVRMPSAGHSPAHHLLTAQQRLFPPQDGSDGQLRSPVTNTVPKSPLQSFTFSFD